MKLLRLLRVAALLLLAMPVALRAADDSQGKPNSMSSDLEPLKGKAFEVAFLQGMIEHHQSAVDMASLAAANAKSEKLKQMAASIITKQKEEIGEMTGWLQQWYGQKPMGNDMAGMGEANMHEAMIKMQMMTKEQLAKLREAKGAAFDEMFLNMMTMHHKEAIRMARLVEGRSDHEELEKLAKVIIKDQAKEVEEMEEMMKS